MISFVSQSFTKQIFRPIGIYLFPIFLFIFTPVNATIIKLDKLPTINQHNAAFDRNASDGNQNGDRWCAPVASVSALLWLADFYDRPKLIPVHANGKKYTTEEFVYYLATRWLGTNDQTGTIERNWARGLWGYLSTTPYKWQMTIYSDPAMTAFDGPTFLGHATVQDLYDEMVEREDDPTAAVLLGYQHRNANNVVEKHAATLQQLDDQKNLSKRYPGKIMDPFYGLLEDIEFEATNDLNTDAKLWDVVAWRDIYLSIAIAPVPVPEPASLGLFLFGMALLPATRRRHGFIHLKRLSNPISS